ncbi:MAG: glycosyltransferase [Planctomycetes bacterium]|nr:glycosyltransferase [Planctomycetota bacterium]MCB9868230.1 glycosyltransferase [Planctomycetota bacterium]MCB9888794.1 glycosyltransferase [Planctomycetota bacterium]
MSSTTEPRDHGADLTPDERARGVEVVRTLKVAVFVVAYNAEAHIQQTLRRIPAEIRDHLTEIYVIDDESRDSTRARAEELSAEIPKLRVYRTPVNQGYGGNQKLGYAYAIERGFDVVVLLHGDGQYAPEVMPRILAPFADPDTAAVFGSRMMVKGAAKRGGMPLYKRVGNAVLTFLENSLLGARLSEFHSGYRAYRVARLNELPFRYNTSDFHFDTEIIVQLLGSRMKIVEVPIPTYYGDEICHVNGIGYAWSCMTTILRSLLNRVHLVYHPKYDLRAGPADYTFKAAPTSLHQHVLSRAYPTGARVVELGAGSGHVSHSLHDRGLEVLALDQARPSGELPFPFRQVDLEGGFAALTRETLGDRADILLALDVIEHLRDPETRVREIHDALRSGGTLVASTGNIAFLPLRLMMLFGQFNYGKKGILDLTHVRLFTVRSFRRLLEGEGFRITRLRGFGPPIRDMVGDSWWLRGLDRLGYFAARIWPSVFAYQLLVEATRLDSVADLLQRTVGNTATKRESAPV